MQYLTINDLIKVLNLSRATIYRKIKNKEFPTPIKQGKFSYFKIDDIEEWIKNLWFYSIYKIAPPLH